MTAKLASLLVAIALAGCRFEAQSSANYTSCIDYQQCTDECWRPYEDGVGGELLACVKACPDPRGVSEELHEPWGLACGGVVDEPELCDDGLAACEAAQQQPNEEKETKQ